MPMRIGIIAGGRWLLIARCLAIYMAIFCALLGFKLAVDRKQAEAPATVYYSVQCRALDDVNCTTPTAKGAPQKCTTEIPKIIHLTFENHMVYANYRMYLKKCIDLNADWNVYLWRDSDSETFIRVHYPSFAAKFFSYRGDLQKSDAVRYAVLHHFGGVYLDMDVECIRPLFPGLQRLSAFVDRERWEQSALLFNRPMSLMNSAMGAVPRHPFFLFVLNRLNSFSGALPVDSTGPGALTKIYADWVKSSEAKSAPNVTVLKSEVFSGIVDPDNPALMKKCERTGREFQNPGPEAREKMAAQLKGFDVDQLDWSHPARTAGGRSLHWMACASLTVTDWHGGGGGRGNSTLGVHRFLHLGYRFASSRRGPKFDLLGEFPGRVRVPGPNMSLVQAPVPYC